MTKMFWCLLIVLFASVATAPRAESKDKKDKKENAEEAAKAAVVSKITAYAECLKKAGLDGEYVVREDDIPATPIAGSSGTDTFATADLVIDANGDEVSRRGVQSFHKGELVRLFAQPVSPAVMEDSLYRESLTHRVGLGPITKMTLQVNVASAYKHNVTRGQGSFQHESPEILSLAITPTDLEVPCETVTAVLPKYFKRVDAATVATWEKDHPEILSGVIVPSVREGMSPTEVEALFGAPERRAEMGGKTIYFYPKMKVTFVAGKVAGIE